jgi:hypothetical protein
MLRKLKLSDEEWERVNLFLGLLSVSLLNLNCVISHSKHWHQHADNAQQSFSAEGVSTLHLAIPALEALHKAWLSRASRPKYAPFARALYAACDKIDKYHKKTADSPAYIMAMRT